MVFISKVFSYLAKGADEFASRHMRIVLTAGPIKKAEFKPGKINVEVEPGKITITQEVQSERASDTK